jgi:hypothetical protein
MSVTPHSTRALAAITLALLLGSACLSAPTTSPPLIGNGHPILFIGNSLTYVNDLPGIVQALADSAKGDSLAVETVGSPDFALIDHWNTGSALAEINRTHWDFVVLQQGPSSVEVNRDTLRMVTKLFAPSIVKAGGRPVLFSAWPTIDRLQDFPRAIESYQLAATDVAGLMAPVASAWLTILTNNPSVQLYNADGLHPTVAGSYLSALVIYSVITGKSPIGLPARLRLRSGATITVDPSIAAVLQQAASDAVK